MAVATTNTRYALDAGSQASLLRSARVQDEPAAAQLRTQLENAGERLLPGSTVTTRTRYTVGRDGQLITVDTKVTTSTKENEYGALADANDRRRGRKYFELQGDNANASLASLSQPRPLLSPSDELQLYAARDSDLLVTPSLTSALISSGNAVAEDGSDVAVEIIRPLDDNDERSAQILALTLRAQASAASVYARNNDIVFNVTPYSELAA